MGFRHGQRSKNPQYSQVAGRHECSRPAFVPPEAYTRADDSLPVTGSDLGATNPVGAGDTNMFRDDELNIWEVLRDVTTSARFFPGAPTSDDLKTWNFNFRCCGRESTRKRWSFSRAFISALSRR